MHLLTEPYITASNYTVMQHRQQMSPALVSSTFTARAAYGMFLNTRYSVDVLRTLFGKI